MQETQPISVNKSQKISQNVDAINQNLAASMQELVEVSSDITVNLLNPISFYEAYKQAVGKKLKNVTQEFIESDYILPDFGASGLRSLCSSLATAYRIMPGQADLPVTPILQPESESEE